MSQNTQNVLDRICLDGTVRTVILAAKWGGPEEWSPRGRGYAAVPDTAVSRAESARHLRAGLDATVTMLRRAGKTVILFEDTPAFRFNPVDRFQSHLIPARDWLRRHLQPGSTTEPGMAGDAELYRTQNAHASAIVQQVGDAEGAAVVDLSARLCASAGCLYSAEGKLLFLDSNHVSDAGAERVLAAFRLPLPRAAPP